MKIIDKIEACIAEDKIFYSFEYFPPKTEVGIENLFQRMESMAKLNPLFIDITWGAGGSTSDLTIQIAATAQNLIGLESQIHMTCTDMPEEAVRKAIIRAKKAGIRNILALRGDPPKGNENWEQTKGGFRYSVDLIRFIKKEHGDYFGISCAGYPEGHPEGSYELDLKYLKKKVDTGADFVITQLFYDCDIFLKFVKDCREIGIKCPIIPGIMPIQRYSTWKRIVRNIKIPEQMKKDLEKLNVDDDAEVKAYGVKQAIAMCRYLMNNGVRGIHFYTLNLEKSVFQILDGLSLIPVQVPRPLPWKIITRREKETVRPIFWANRPRSYLARTMEWDEYPNGRWGDSRSPAFGELSDYHLLGLYYISKEKRKRMWGEKHTSLESIYNVFVNFMEGKIPYLPWYEKKLDLETELIRENLIKLNKHGFLTINSQPRVNAAKSEDKTVGWGEPGGYVYQKAYIEFFTSPEKLEILKRVIKKYKTLSFHAVNVHDESYSNTKGPTNAVTWGVFPDSEILQPTIVSADTFMIWKTEAFALLKTKWGEIYPEGSESRKLIDHIHDTFFLVNIVDNDYINGNIMSIFDEMIAEIQKSPTEKSLVTATTTNQ